MAASWEAEQAEAGEEWRASRVMRALDIEPLR